MSLSASNRNAMPSGSILFSDLAPTRIGIRRALTSNNARDSWASQTPSDASFEATETGHIRFEDEVDEFVDTVSSLVVPSFSNDALFGSTSPRKRGPSVSSIRSRPSLDSMRSSSVGTSSTPLTPASLREISPVMASKDLKLTPPRPRLMRMASDQTSYSGSSPSSKAPAEHSADKSTPKNNARNNRDSVTSSSSGRDGLMIAMAQLEQELQRTMVTLSSPLASPVPSFSKASTRSKSGSRRPSTADIASTSGSLSGTPQPFLSAPSPSRLRIPRFDSEPWGDLLLREMDVAAPASPRRAPAKDFAYRPTSQYSISSITSNCSHNRADETESDTFSIPSLVFDGRQSGSSGTSSAPSSNASDAVPRVREFVTGGKSSRPDQFNPKLAKSSSRSQSNKPSLYGNKNAARSVPSLSALPPREPLPPLPSMPLTTKDPNNSQNSDKSGTVAVDNKAASSPAPLYRMNGASSADVNTHKPLPSVPSAALETSQSPATQTRLKRAMSLRRLFG